jgi:hypothetical protein
MNENLEASGSPTPALAGNVLAAEIPSPRRAAAYWLKRFLACNPFYLVSAALLLFGFYRVSVDPGFLSGEVRRLVFSFTSLQFYEVLLVVTAIFLARRRIWYDSTLLVGLENLFLLVPFILISQAALIDKRMLGAMCLAGGLLAVARCHGLKWSIAELNFPRGLLNIGLAMLAINTALPVIYRVLHEYKFGTKPDWGAAYFTNEYTWLLLLPALCGLAHLLPPPRETGSLLAQRRWFPVGLFSLWLAGTGVHIYCLGYVYDFSLRPELLAPAIWVLLWTLRQRLTDFAADVQDGLRAALLVPPLLATLVAAPQSGHGVFLALTILNAAIFGGIYFRQRGSRLALHLALISLVSLVGGMPEDWGRSVVGEVSRAGHIGVAVAGYLLLCAALSRNPKLGIFGSLVSAIVVILVLNHRADAIHWACQTGLVVLLLHSLHWDDEGISGAHGLRNLAGSLWAAHAFLWTHLGGEAWMACAAATAVLGGYLAARIIGGQWGPRVLPIAAVLVALSGPTHFTASGLQAAPTGLLAVVGSFLLFGLGTLAAANKHRWLRVENEKTK